MRLNSCIFLVIFLLPPYFTWSGEHIYQPSGPTPLTGASIAVKQDSALEVRAAAEYLRDILNRAGSPSWIQPGDGTKGIAIGLPGDFPKSGFVPEFKTDDIREQQAYEIKSHPEGVYIIGATPMAVEYAVADFLHRLGYRRFFPSPDWEVLPSKLEFGGHVREVPDYYHRNIWSNFGVWPEFRKDTGLWARQMRLGGFPLSTGHVYEHFIRDHKAEFEKHPEYYGLVGGERKSSKLCISNPRLRQLFIDYVMNAFELNPSLKSHSADPSDMDKWCECQDCLRIGTPSTRAVLLANETAEAVSRKYGNKTIGMYAYNYHSPPPQIDVRKNVVVSIATGFIHGGYSFEELVKGWRKKKAVIGIREYYDVIIWSRNLPGGSQASDLTYICRSIPKFHAMGGRYFTAESGDGWGSCGLGHYLAARLLWNKDESPDMLLDDFFTGCFGPAAAKARQFFNLLDGSRKYPLSNDWLGRAWRALYRARQAAAGSEAVMKRLDALAMYVRYVELYLQYLQATEGKAAKKAFGKIVNYVIAIRPTRMVHSLGILREQKRLGPGILIPLDGTKQPPLPNRTAIETFISTGIVNNQLLKFKPVAYSENLTLRTFANKRRHGELRPVRDSHQFYIWVTDIRNPIRLRVTGGLITHYRNRGNVQLRLDQIGGSSETGSRETLVCVDESTPPDGREHLLELRPVQPGLHRLTVSDGNDRTQIKWDRKLPIVKPVLDEKAPGFDGTAFFYVPKGARELGFYCSASRGTIKDPAGKEVIGFSGKADYFCIPVPPGTDGKVWSVNNFNGILCLLTAPSYFSFREDILLLPEEVK